MHPGQVDAGRHHRGMNAFPASLLLIVTMLTPAWSVDSPAIPLGIFGLQAGQEVAIAGTTAPADAAGLPLPIGKPVEVAWKSQDGKPNQVTVTSIDAGSGPALPAWALDEPVIQADGHIIAVGHGYANSVTIARVMAIANARMQAMRATPGEVTSKVSEGPGETDAQSKQVMLRSSETTVRHSGKVSSQTTDCVITVCADPATAPPVPTKPGVELLLSDRPGDAPVRCWVRVNATVGAARAPTAAEKARKEQAEKELDKLIERELSGGAGNKPAPAPKP